MQSWSWLNEDDNNYCDDYDYKYLMNNICFAGNPGHGSMFVQDSAGAKARIVIDRFFFFFFTIAIIVINLLFNEIDHQSKDLWKHKCMNYICLLLTFDQRQLSLHIVAMMVGEYHTQSPTLVSYMNQLHMYYLHHGQAIGKAYS